jgi:hypothetical protein
MISPVTSGAIPESYIRRTSATFGADPLSRFRVRAPSTSRARAPRRRGSGPCTGCGRPRRAVRTARRRGSRRKAGGRDAHRDRQGVTPRRRRMARSTSRAISPRSARSSATARLSSVEMAIGLNRQRVDRSRDPRCSNVAGYRALVWVPSRRNGEVTDYFERNSPSSSVHSDQSRAAATQNAL